MRIMTREEFHAQADERFEIQEKSLAKEKELRARFEQTLTEDGWESFGWPSSFQFRKMNDKVTFKFFIPTPCDEFVVVCHKSGRGQTKNERFSSLEAALAWFKRFKFDV